MAVNRETFDAGMDLLIKQWPNYPVNPDVYWMVLHELDDGVFKAAVLGCLESCKFFPVIAEIREKAIATLNSAGLLPAPGDQAWAQVLASLSAWHPDLGWLAWNEAGTAADANGPCPLPPLIEQALTAMGGIGVVWNADDHERSFIRRDFIGFYERQRETELAYAGHDLLGQGLPERTGENPVLVLMEAKQ